MSYSLQVKNGDLKIGIGGLQTVSGGTKLVQDLRCAILEPMGTDSLHLWFGSVIDGGVDPSGNYHEGVIGSLNDSAAATFVKSEIQRVCKAHQAQQIARNQADVMIYGRSTLTADEVLLSVQNIETQQVDVHMLVSTTLQTGTGSVPITIGISGA